MSASKLAMKVVLNDHETPASFVSRLAFRNGATPRDFCSDMGLRWPHVCSSHQDQLAYLSVLVGVSLDRLTRWGAQVIRPRHYQVGKTRSSNGVFRRAATRICPLCIRHAVMEHGWEGAHQTVDWLVTCLYTCGHHSVPLLKLPNAGHAHETYDVVTRVKEHWEGICYAAEQYMEPATTMFEAYVRKRIEFGNQNDWLAKLELHELAQGALFLGSELIWGSQNNNLTPLPLNM